MERNFGVLTFDQENFDRILYLNDLRYECDALVNAAGLILLN